MSAVNQLTKEIEEMSLRTKYRDQATKLLAGMNLKVGDTKPPVMKPGSSGNGQWIVRSNMYVTDVVQPRDIYLYQVRICGYYTMKDKPGQNAELERVFTDHTNEEYFVMERREACKFIFEAIRGMNDKVFGPRLRYYYDLRSKLYSTELFEKPTTTFNINLEDFVENPTTVDQALFQRCQRFTMTLQKTEFVISSDTAKLDSNTDLENADVNLLRFLEVASSQDAINSDGDMITFPNGTTYVYDPPKCGFDPIVELGRGRYLSVGVQKSARLTRNANDKLQIGLFVEPKMTPFHDVKTVFEKVNGMQNRDEIERLVRGLFVRPRHLENTRALTVKVLGLGGLPTEEAFEYNGQSITVHDYFAKNSNYPVLVVQQGKGRECRYPMELCEVLDNQRVMTSAMDTEMISTIIKAAAVPPKALVARTESGVKTLQLTQSQYLAAAQMKVKENPVELNARVIEAPSLRYEGRSERYNAQTNQWRQSRFAVAGNTPHVWAIYVVYRGRTKGPFTEEDLRKFCTEFTNMASNRGLSMPKPTEIQILEYGNASRSQTQLEDRIKLAVEHKCQFVMVLTNKDDSAIHLTLKALEQRYDVATQNVTLAMARAAAGLQGPPKRQTLENITNKTNMKLGGLNHHVCTGPRDSMLGQDDLFIGFSLNHVAAGMGRLDSSSAPSVFGYAANDTSVPVALTGDYIYQQPMREGDLNAIKNALEKILERTKGNRSTNLPKRVIIYRSGCSEGQFPDVMRFEVPLIRAAIQYYLGDGVKLVYVVVTKIHNVRLTKKVIPDGRPKDQNLPSGVVVDKEIVNALLPEFYLTSHVALQGTGKAPRYSVLCNDANMSMNELQQISHHLCFAHQIIASPISLPSPLYVAEMNAKRGRNILRAPSNRHPDDLIALNAQLSLVNKEIRNTRVTA